MSQKITCPHCKKEVELQSKAGECLLAHYKSKKVPIVIASDLHGDLTDYNSTCDHCGERFVLIAPVQKTIKCKLVPLTDELVEKLEEEKENFDDGASYDHLGDDYLD